jgi:tRNA(fMet)-specific endonuclease VapC
MIAFDTDVLVEIFAGSAEYVRRGAETDPEQQVVPVIVAEEIMRGRLNAIRQAEAGKSKLSVPRAYELFQDTFSDFRSLTILPYAPAAHVLFEQWRQQRIRVGTHDLRIAAICVAHSAKLISRNRRDFELVPGLDVEFWERP